MNPRLTRQEIDAELDTIEFLLPAADDVNNADEILKACAAVQLEKDMEADDER